MFFRMLRRIVASANNGPFAFRHWDQQSIPMRNDASEDVQADRQKRAIAWFLVQPKNIAAGRLVLYPGIPVVRSNFE